MLFHTFFLQIFSAWALSRLVVFEIRLYLKYFLTNKKPPLINWGTDIIPRYHPASHNITVADTLLRTNIRVSCNVENTWTLNWSRRLSSGMIFFYGQRPVYITHRLSAHCLRNLLFPILRFLLKLTVLYEKPFHLSNTFLFFQIIFPVLCKDLLQL